MVGEQSTRRALSAVNKYKPHGGSHALGIDLTTTLPDHSGRPIYLLDDCEPIKELL